MEKKTAYPWVEFYIEFANKLLAFADNRTPLVDMIKNVYKQIGINLPKLEKDGEVLDIDPFTLFGLFNKGITTENRIKIINAFAEKLGVTAVAPTEFEGVPVLNNQNATYYDFAGKGSRSDDIDNLWKVFTSAVEYADKNTESGKADFIKYYNLCLKQKGVRWNLTIGLYWVRPYTYINLDSRNRWFITNPVNTSADFVDMLPRFDNVPSGEEYLRLCEMSTDLIASGNYKYSSLPELSAFAWSAAKEDDEVEKTAAENEKTFRKWLAAQTSANGTPLQASTVSNNANALKKVCVEMPLPEFPNLRYLFSVTDLERFKQIREAILKHPDYKKIDKKHGNGYLNSAITIWYEKFLAWLADGGDPAALADGGSVNALADDESSVLRYWMYTVFDDESWEECQKKGIMVMGMDLIGDYTQYESKEQLRQALIEKYEGDSSRKNQALMTWNFSRTIKINDVIFAKRANTLVGKGVVTSKYSFDDDRKEHKSVREVKWLQAGEWEHPGNAVAKRLTDITPYTDYVEKLNAIFAAEIMDEDEDQSEIVYPPYTAEDFLKEVYMEEADYNTLAAVLKNKKNIILQGAPGVGKTFAAKRLAYSIMGVKDKDRVMMVQFHQSYSYEDFIMGFRPSATVISAI